MNVADKLGQLAREGSAGASSYRGFTYQHHWTLWKLLEIHDQGVDYVALVDHHDDLVLWLDPPDGPLRCYQVKVKKRGNWTTARLVKRKGEDLSILGKLYHHRIFFDDAVEALEFVSNARFSVGSLTDGSDSRGRTRILCTELGTEDAEKIRSALIDEHELDEAPDFEPLLSLQTAPLSVEGFREHTLGRVADVLEGVSGGKAVRSKAAYHALMDEVQRKAAVVATQFPAADALTKKSLDRATMAEMFKEIVGGSPADSWPRISEGLTAAGYGPVQIAKMRRTHGTMAARRTSPEWQFVDELVRYANEQVIALDDSLALEDCLTAVVHLLEDHELAVGFSRDELEVVALEGLFND